MKNTSKPLRIALVAALEGILLYRGTPVSIRDTFAAADDIFPRVIINGFSTFEQGHKSGFLYESTGTIKISSKFLVNATSNMVDEIENDLLGIVAPAPAGPFVTLDGFFVWAVNLDGSVPQEYEINPHKFIDKNLRLNFKIQQL